MSIWLGEISELNYGVFPNSSKLPKGTLGDGWMALGFALSWLRQAVLRQAWRGGVLAIVAALISNLNQFFASLLIYSVIRS
ncbi:MAG: hypothetical protein MUC97_10290, partial [Bernardetiaceae bacterium]|nr:hypothetical protein [Bernardetiaceae bacterium]